MSDDGHTWALVCAGHPPLSEWPMTALVLGACPKCGTTELYSAEQFARMIRAQNLTTPPSAGTE